MADANLGLRARRSLPVTLPQPRLGRERLVTRLAGLAPGGVALLMAPGGYGLTTLLGLVADQSRGRVVWIAGGTSNRWISELWSQLVTGLGAGTESTVVSRSLDSPTPENVSALLAVVGRGPRTLLVIDDVPRDDAVEDLLQLLIDRLPATVRMLLRVRCVPRLDLSRPLASGRVLTLGASDLALTRAESEEYLRALAPQLGDRPRSALAEIAGGWIAALRAAAGNVEPGREPATWLLGPGLELLFGHVMRQLGPQDVELLVATSIMERLTPEACDAVLGRSDSATRLAELSSQGLLTRGPGPGAAVYDVQGLFREYLRAKLAERGRDAVVRAHRAAGEWLAQAGDAEAAIGHLLECGQVEPARAVLASHVRGLLDSGRSEQVRRWYRRTPELAVPTEHLHLLAAAWSELLTGDVSAATPHLLALEAAAAEARTVDLETADGTPAHWLRVETQFLRVHVESWNGHTGTARKRLERVRAAQGQGWTRTSEQAAAFQGMRLDLWHGELAAARESLAEVAARPGTVSIYREVTIPSLRALLAAEEGRAHRALYLAGTALDSLQETGQISAFDHCEARLARARALLDIGDIASAEREAATVQATAASVGHVPYHVLSLLALARARAQANSIAWPEPLEAARVVLREHEVRGPLVAVVDRAQVEAAILAADRARARRDLAAIPSGPGRDQLRIRLLAMGGPIRAADLQDAVQSTRASSPREVVNSRMLMAAYTATTRKPEAAMHLRAAAGTARDHGMLTALRGRSPELLALAGHLAATDDAVAALLANVRVPADQPAPAAARLPAGRSLTPGEHRLLELLATVRTTREIAEHLGVSPNTVKTRLRRLYAKLGVHDRTSALREAGLRLAYTTSTRPQPIGQHR